MTKKPIFILVGFLLAIFLLGKYTTWQIENWQRSLPTGFPKIEEEEIPKLPQFFSPETFSTGTFPFPESFPFPGVIPPALPTLQSTEIEEKEFISQDEKLKIKYPGNWVRIETETFQDVLPENLVKNYDLRLLFLAFRFGRESSGQFTIGEMLIDIQVGVEEVFKEIKKHIKEKGWEMEIVDIEIKEKEILYEAIYKKTGSPTLHSKDKLIALESLNDKKKVFWIEILSSSMEWEYIKKEVEKIFDSIQIVE